MADFQAEWQEIQEIREIADRNYRKPPTYRNIIDPFTIYDDDEFRKRYRLTKNSTRYVIDLIRQELEHVKVSINSISVEVQVLVCLRFYAKGSYQVESGDLHGISQPSVSRIISRVSLSIARLLPQFIKYPDNVIELREQFYQIAQFPNVVGAIDCTHIRIKNPNKDEAMLYMNRKGFYSLNVQVVCDAECKILDIVRKWRGSVHDSRIWHECGLKKEFESGTKRDILLGDGGYPCCRYLLTPLLNPITPQEHNYNRAHISTRNAVERCFGQWKSMFRALQNNILISLDTAKTAITAMAVLYNIRKVRRENAEYDDADSDQEGIDNDAQRAENENLGDGNLFRRQFIQQHF